jgi:hypothetical protein
VGVYSPAAEVLMSLTRDARVRHARVRPMYV